MLRLEGVSRRFPGGGVAVRESHAVGGPREGRPRV